MLRISSRAEVESIVRSDWKVLDVGAGDNPFSKATCLLDADPRAIEIEGKNYTENPTLSVKANGIELVTGSIEEMPFADQSFDFVYAAHIIEHVDDPSKALSELARVAPRGYIEVPRAWFEFVDGSPFHKWLIDLRGGELVFRPKTEIEQEFSLSHRILERDRPIYCDLFAESVTGQGNVDSGGESREKSVCHVCVYWEDNIPHRLEEASMYAGTDMSVIGEARLKRGHVPISVIVHTRDEASQIGDCLATCLGWADEVIVADMQSRDMTRFIARTRGARVLDVPLEDEFDRTRNDSAATAQNDWILFLDADERLTPEVRETIESLIAKDDNSVAAYQLPFKTISFGRWIQHAGGWWPSYKSPPLLRKGRFTFPGQVHLPAQIDGQIVRVEPQSDRDAIEHYSHPSVDAYFKKLNRYTSLEVGKLKASGESPNWHKAAEKMAGAMRWYYDDTDGKKDGLAGFLLALGSGIYEAAAEMKFMESCGVGELPLSTAEFFERAAVIARREQPPKELKLPSWSEQLCSWLCCRGDGLKEVGFRYSGALAQGAGWIIVELSEALKDNDEHIGADGELVLLRDDGNIDKEAVRQSLTDALASTPHCLESTGIAERWWLVWLGDKVEVSLNVCSLTHANALNVMGGGEVQLFQTIRELRKYGVISDVKVGGGAPSGYPMYHVYSLHHALNATRAVGAPYVLSPIYWDRSELAWIAPRITALFARSETGDEIDSGYAALCAQVEDSEPLHMDFSEDTKCLISGASVVAPNADSECDCIKRSMGGAMFNSHMVSNAFCELPEASEGERLIKWPDNPFVLCVGRVEPNKNQLTLIWALRDSGLDVVLIGSEPDQEYANLCRQFGGRSIHMLGQQPPSVVRNAYTRAAAHCLPSFAETPGIANLEAASLGCPIVVSNRGAEQEYFGEAAWYCDPLDPDSIVRSVIEACDTRGTERTIKLQDLVRGNYTWEKTAERLAEIYSSVTTVATEAV